MMTFAAIFIALISVQAIFSRETSHSYTFSEPLEYLAYDAYIRCKDSLDTISDFVLTFIIVPEEYNPNNLPSTGAGEGSIE